MFQAAYAWKLKIIRSRRKTVSIEIRPNEILVRAPIQMTDPEIQKLLERKREWIRKHQQIVQERQQNLKQAITISESEIHVLTEKAKLVIPEKVKFYAERIGVEYGKITIRCQRTRWGSCSGKGNLNFNCLLMLFPDKIIDSVVVHELCHRKHMNHSAAFYNEVRNTFPDYDECYLWLKENGGKYLRSLPNK